MGTLIKLNRHFEPDDTHLILNQLQDWQNDLDFWNTECNYFLRIMEWKKLYLSDDPNPLRAQFQSFADNELLTLTEHIRKCSIKWKVQETLYFKMQYRELYLDYHQLKIKFRSLKAKALSSLIKTKVSLQIY